MKDSKILPEWEREQEEARKHLGMLLPEFQRKHMIMNDDSMTDPQNFGRSIPAGSLVSLGEETKTIHPGSYYAFALGDGVPTIRIIEECDIPGHIHCVALNPSYPPFIEQLANLKGLCKVLSSFVVQSWN